MKEVIVRKGNDNVVRRVTVQTTTRKKKATKKKKVAKKIKAREVPFPQRTPHNGVPGLSKAQWERRGEYLRILRNNEFIRAEALSLNDLDSVMLSVHRCSLMRAVYNHQHR